VKAYSIFDDFSQKAITMLTTEGIDLTVHPMGVPRPDNAQMKIIMENYDCVIIGTSQKITKQMFDNITTPRIIATASVGLDHIEIPEDKESLVTVINTPKANAQSVAEFTMGCALFCCKRFAEGSKLYAAGKNNKALYQKPEDLAGKIIGVIGAGNISVRIMEYADFFGMKILCWTLHPERHQQLVKKNVCFTSLLDIVKEADVISVNLPNNAGTKGIISSELINEMKENCIFISVSRLDTIDLTTLLCKAENHPGFYVCVDIDLDKNVINQLPDLPNVLVTPHIAGGTVETRKRMFLEVAEGIIQINNLNLRGSVEQQYNY